MFCLYETFDERSCEQLKIAKSEQINVEISANIWNDWYVVIGTALSKRNKKDNLYCAIFNAFSNYLMETTKKFGGCLDESQSVCPWLD